MAYNSSHTGPQIDAAVELLGQVQSARDSTKSDLAQVKVLAAEVGTNAVEVAFQAETIAVQASEVLAGATAVEQTRSEVVAASLAADEAKDIAVLSAASAQDSQASANASEAAAAQSQLAAGLSEQVSAEYADTVSDAAQQVAADMMAARASAESALASARNAEAVVTGGTAAIVSSPGKIPIANASGKIDSDWLDEDIARSESVIAATEAGEAAAEIAGKVASRTAGFLAPSANPPLLRDNGLPLQFGDRYFNAEDQSEYLYTGNGWTANDSLQAISDFMDALSNKLDTSKGTELVGTRLPFKNLLGKAVGRALSDKLYDHVSIKDFVLFGDEVMSNPEKGDWYPPTQRAFDSVQVEVEGKIRGVSIEWPSGQYTMSRSARLDLAPAGTKNTGAVGIRLIGAGSGQTALVAPPTNTTGFFHLTSGRNMEVFSASGFSFLSDLPEDAPTNNGIALLIDSALKRGDTGYGDQPRWSCEVNDIYIGGYGTTAGDIARRGNWLKGINIKDKYHPKLSNIYCLARYANVVGARTACSHAIHFEGCYSPEMDRMYIHGGWEKSIWLDDVFNIVGGYEDFRLTNFFIAGSDHGFGGTHEFDNRTDTASLYEPGGAISVGHVNCRKFGITLRHHRQVVISDIYGYVARESRTGGELLPSIILLDGAADVQIRGEFFEEGFYNSDDNASCAVRLEGACEGVSIDAHFGCGGIGVRNNSTYTIRKSILADAKIQTSRRLTTYPTFKLFVDKTGTMTGFSNTLLNSQDRRTMESYKPSATYPVTYRLAGMAPGQMIGGGYEIAGLNSARTVVNQAIISSRFTNNIAGSEASYMSLLVLGEGSIKEGFRVSPTLVDGETYGTILVRSGSSNVFRRVKVGAADSAGSGRRVLYIDN